MLEYGTIVAMIIAAEQLLKKYGIKSKYTPLLNILFGVIGSVFLLDGDFPYLFVRGVILGLTASGLYDQTKIFSKG